jgi:hypothetical protein
MQGDCPCASACEALHLLHDTQSECIRGVSSANNYFHQHLLLMLCRLFAYIINHYINVLLSLFIIHNQKQHKIIVIFCDEW